MRVAYLVNQYPHVSHSFIRREIAALESLGVSVERFSIRASAAEVVDPADRRGAQRTHILLGGPFALVGGLLSATGLHPLRFFRALRMTLIMGWRSQRGVGRHLAYLAEACLLQKRLQKLQVQRLHAHFGTNPAAVALLCCILGGPTYSFTVHGPEE